MPTVRLRCNAALLTSLTLSAVSLIQTYSRPSFAELPPAPAAQVQVSPEAREQFQLGVSLLQDPDGARYEEAFKAFSRAYATSPSWKILGNLGLSAMKLERYSDGIEAYERYLAASGGQLDAAERKQVEKDLSVMKQTSGEVTLVVTGATNVSIEDTRSRSVGGAVVNTYAVPADGRLVVKLAAGKHSLVASGDGKQASLALNVEAGGSVEKTLELSAAVAPAAATTASTNDVTADGSSSTLRTAGLIVGGVGIAALIGGGVTGFIGLGKKSDLDDQCPDNECRFTSDAQKSAMESERDSLSTMGTITTALLIGGGVLTATGVTLYVVGGPSEPERVAVSPSFGSGFAGLSAQGAF